MTLFVTMICFLMIVEYRSGSVLWFFGCQPFKKNQFKYKLFANV